MSDEPTALFNPLTGTFTETKRETIDGYAYISGNGNLVIDTHPSDSEHLLARQTRDTQPLYDCRHYLGELIPKEWRNRRGTFFIDRTQSKEGEVFTVSISFVPKVD